jgi:DNA replication and repair protein RecF
LEPSNELLGDAVHIKTLSLRQFRSYEKLDLALSPGVNVFSGPNGAGKSNVLESVALLATGASHRDAEPRSFFSWDKDGFALRGEFDGEEKLLIEARQERGRPKAISVNNAFQKRLRDWVGRVPVISFSPEDLGLVKGEPSARRRALNGAMAQAWAGAADMLQRYNAVLEQRNAALKSVQEGRASPASLEPWDLALLREGAALTLARREFLAAFAPSLAEGCRAVASDETGLVYKPSFNLPIAAGGPDPAKGEPAEVVAANRRRLLDLRDGEIALGSSLIGPHRDDVEFTVQGRSAKAFGSQGQQRTVAVAFKLAERAFIRKNVGRAPLCLMDDMFSELDSDRRRNLQTLLSDGAQCLVTVTSLHEWERLAPLPAEAKVFEVGGGRAEPAGLPCVPAASGAVAGLPA